MKNLQLLFLLPLFLIGCIELKEEIHFNKDGSGSAKISVKTFCKMMMEKDYHEMSESEKAELSQMEGHFMFDSKALKDKVSDIKRIEGVTNVRFKVNHSYNPEKNDVSYVSFDFSSISVLNSALVSLYNTSNKNKMTHVIRQKKGSKQIDRMATTFFYRWDSHYSHFSDFYRGDDIKSYMANNKMKEQYCFDKVKIEYAYSFDYQIAKPVYNNIVRIGKDGKSARWSIDANLLMNSPSQVSCAFREKPKPSTPLKWVSGKEAQQRWGQLDKFSNSKSIPALLRGKKWKNVEGGVCEIIYKRDLDFKDLGAYGKPANWDTIQPIDTVYKYRKYAGKVELYHFDSDSSFTSTDVNGKNYNFSYAVVQSDLISMWGSFWKVVAIAPDKVLLISNFNKKKGLSQGFGEPAKISKVWTYRIFVPER